MWQLLATANNNVGGFAEKRITHLIDFEALKELIRVKDDPQDD